jgi:hypothetical protein
MTSIDEKALPETNVEEFMEEAGGSVVTKDRSDWSNTKDRKASIKSFMSQKKIDFEFDLTEDVYALISVCPVFSAPFFTALLVIATKLTVYIILADGIEIHQRVYSDRIATTAVKGLLIPVSVAMQEDLMDTYYFFANAIYDEDIMKISPSATKSKMYISYVMRLFDGLLSLYVNFAVMLTTPSTLAVFLNFAALQFLQSIDDVFYELIEKGFVGDTMEHWCIKCSEIKIKRRHQENNTRMFISVSAISIRSYPVSPLEFVTLFGLCLRLLNTTRTLGTQSMALSLTALLLRDSDTMIE